MRTVSGDLLSRVGPYAIVREIGRGGMGVVYLARDERLDRDVAVKALPDDLAHDADRLGRLAREAKLLASLSHPNLASIHGLEEVDGRVYLILEHVPGPTLAERLRGGALPLDEALAIAKQIAEAVSAAHDQGIVHRDLKPGNIKLAPSEQVKVLDFGLAKAGDQRLGRGDAHSPTKTSPYSPTIAGTILGTAAYMSPEQARGRSVDKRTDVWAFGVVLYEMLSGANPFAGETVHDSIGAVLHKEPDWKALPGDTPAPVRRLLARCLVKDRRSRLHDMADARLEIEEALAGPSSSIPGLAAAPQRRSPFAGWRVAAAIAAVLAGLVLGVWIRDAFGPAPATTRETAVTRFTLDLPAGFKLAGSDSGMNDLAVSRDGRTVALVLRGASGGSEIHVRQLDAFQGRFIPGTRDATQPFFSPDGRWLGFHSGDRLMKVSLDGGPPVTICPAEGWAAAAWLDDDTIVFVGTAPYVLMRVSAAGGEPTELASVVKRLGGVLSVAAVPGKRQLLVAGWHGPTIPEGYDVIALSLDDGSATTVIGSAVHPFLLESGHLVFQRMSSLLAARLDLERMAVVPPIAPVLEGVATNDWADGAQAFVAPAGTLVFVPGARHGPGRRLTWIDRRGSLEPVSERRDAFTGDLRLSPDGKRLVVATLRNSGEFWSYELERDVLVRLPSEEGCEGEPVWSPDGQRIACHLWMAPGLPTGIRIVSLLRPGEGRSFFANQFWKPQDWTKDGTRLLLTGFSEGEPPQSGLFLWSPDEDRPPELALRGLDESAQVRLSPDDEFLAYEKIVAGNTQVFVRRFPDSGEEWQVSLDGGETPDWSPAGDEVYFIAGGAMMSARVTTDGGFAARTPVKLFDLPPTVEHETYDVAPDGRFVMIELADWETEPAVVRVVVGWSAEVERRLAEAGE
jgi:Tol biopolymer transport system component